jgi:hypothetical protein
MKLVVVPVSKNLVLEWAAALCRGPSAPTAYAVLLQDDSPDPPIIVSIAQTRRVAELLAKAPDALAFMDAVTEEIIHVDDVERFVADVKELLMHISEEGT